MEGERKMLNVELDKATGIAILRPDGALSQNDFESAASIIDPYIETSGKLKGLIISVKTFPGWKSFDSLLKHFKFVKAHHRKVLIVDHYTVVVQNVAIVIRIMENLENAFVRGQRPEIRQDFFEIKKLLPHFS